MGLKKEKYQMLRLYCNILEALLLHSSVMVGMASLAWWAGWCL